MIHYCSLNVGRVIFKHWFIIVPPIEWCKTFFLLETLVNLVLGLRSHFIQSKIAFILPVTNSSNSLRTFIWSCRILLLIVNTCSSLGYSLDFVKRFLLKLVISHDSLLIKLISCLKAIVKGIEFKRCGLVLMFNRAGYIVI